MTGLPSRRAPFGAAHSCCSFAVALALAGAMPAGLHAQARTAPSARPATVDPAAQTLTFANAPLADVIRTLASMLGRTVILSEIPDVRVTFSTPTGALPVALESVLESLLEAHGLMLVPSGAVAQVLPAEKAPVASLARHGNLSSASIPAALVGELGPRLSAGSLKLVLCGFGVGLAWGAVALEPGPCGTWEA